MRFLMDDEKEQKLIGRKTVKEGADRTLLHKAISRLPPASPTEWQKADYERRMARLEEAVARMKGKQKGGQKPD